MDFSFLGAGLAIGLAAIGIAIGQGYLIYNSVSVIGKNPKMSGYFLTITVLGVALVESAAIYGLIVAFNILSTTFTDPLASVGAGLAIGLSGLGVGIGEGLLVGGAISAMNKSPENKTKILTYMILFLALVESSAIYGLVVAFRILSDVDISGFLSIGIGLSIGLAGLGVGVGEGILSKKSLIMIGNKPAMASFYLTMTILGIALVETSAIYGLIISFSLFDAELIGDTIRFIGVGLSIGLAGLGVGIGEGLLVSGSLEAVSIFRANKTKLLTYMILFIALVESAAIYGLLISFQLLSTTELVGLSSIGAGLAVGLAGLGVGVGEGFLSGKSMYIIGKRPSLSMFFLTITILGIALVESAVIYGLVISLNIISNLELLGIVSLGAGVAIGLAGLGAGIGEGFMVGGAFDAICRNPSYRTKILTIMILGVALVESAAIYGLIIAYSILS